MVCLPLLQALVLRAAVCVAALTGLVHGEQLAHVQLGPHVAQAQLLEQVAVASSVSADATSSIPHHRNHRHAVPFGGAQSSTHYYRSADFNHQGAVCGSLRSDAAAVCATAVSLIHAIVMLPGRIQPSCTSAACACVMLQQQSTTNKQQCATTAILLGVITAWKSLIVFTLRTLIIYMQTPHCTFCASVESTLNRESWLRRVSADRVACREPVAISNKDSVSGCAAHGGEGVHTGAGAAWGEHMEW